MGYYSFIVKRNKSNLFKMMRFGHDRQGLPTPFHTTRLARILHGPGPWEKYNNPKVEELFYRFATIHPERIPDNVYIVVKYEKFKTMYMTARKLRILKLIPKYENHIPSNCNNLIKRNFKYKY